MNRYKYVSNSDLTADKYNVDVFLWNYSSNNMSRLYPSDINYDVEFRITDSAGEQFVADNAQTGKKASSYIGEKTVEIYKEVTENNVTTQELVGTFGIDNYSSVLSVTNEKLVKRNDNKATSKTYTFKYSGNWDLDSNIDSDVCIQMIAAPKSAHTDLSTISAVIGLKKYVSNTQNDGWVYSLSEERNTTSKPSDYDGYNLVLTGSGSATITIQWDPSHIAVNKTFYESSTRFAEVENISDVTGSTWKQIVINADASNYTTNQNRNRYVIQLYKVAGDFTPDNWSFISHLDEQTSTVTNGSYINVTVS